MLKWVFCIVVTLAILAGCWDILKPPPVHAQDQTKSEWFKGLRRPGAIIGCCSEADCKPTHSWKYDGQKWWADVHGKMTPIPDEKILPDPPYPWDPEQAVVCSSASGLIYCFLPPLSGI